MVAYSYTYFGLLALAGAASAAVIPSAANGIPTKRQATGGRELEGGFSVGGIPVEAELELPSIPNIRIPSKRQLPTDSQINTAAQDIQNQLDSVLGRRQNNVEGELTVGGKELEVELGLGANGRPQGSVEFGPDKTKRQTIEGELEVGGSELEVEVGLGSNGRPQGSVNFGPDRIKRQNIEGELEIGGKELEAEVGLGSNGRPQGSVNFGPDKTKRQNNIEGELEVGGKELEVEVGLGSNGRPQGSVNFGADKTRR